MDRARYLRLAAVEGLDRARLAAMRVVVVGAGAVGNEIVKNLVLLGTGAIDVHDFDRVEVHNLTRSIFLRETDVGAGKATAVAARAAEVDLNVRITPVQGDAWHTLRLGELGRCDALVAAVDNLEARMRLGQLAQLAGVDYVNAGIDGRFASVETFPHRRIADCGCYECHLPASAYRKVAERYSCGWLRRALLTEATIPTTPITASIAGALAVQAVLRAAEADGARRVLVDTRHGTSTVSQLARNSNCVGCAPLQPRPRRVAGRADWRAALASHAPNATYVLLSDALIFGYACSACGDASRAVDYVGHRASAFDDRIMRCAACGELGVRIDIRSEATLDALERLCGLLPPPVKYLLAHAGEPDAVCIDLEDGE